MPAIPNAFHSTVTAGLSCGGDTIVSRDQVCRSSQYGVIERKSTGSTGSGGRGRAYKMQPVDTSGYPDIIELTLDISGYRSCDADCPQHTPTPPTFSTKHGYLSADKVKEIEYWLAEVNLEGDDRSLEGDAGPPFRLPCNSPQESWPRSILHRL